MPRLKSKVAADILKDRGAPQKLSPDEQCSGTDMDDVDRGSDWPDIEVIDDAPGTPAEKAGFNGQQGARGKPEGLD